MGEQKLDRREFLLRIETTDFFLDFFQQFAVMIMMMTKELSWI